jgi:hypothetical protein
MNADLNRRLLAEGKQKQKKKKVTMKGRVNGN